jgi:hypothetical protein
MFVLQGLDKPIMCCPFLFCFHDASLNSLFLLLPLIPLGGWTEVPFTLHIHIKDPSKLARFSLGMGAD